MKMELFPAIPIIIVVLIIIIVIVVIVIVAMNGSKGSSNNNTCTNQNDCPSGFVCVHDSNTNSNICKAGLGTSCNNDSDCSPELVCLTQPNSDKKVCSRRDSTSENITRATPIIPETTNCSRRRINWVRPQFSGSYPKVNIDSQSQINRVVISHNAARNVEGYTPLSGDNGRLSPSDVNPTNTATEIPIQIISEPNHINRVQTVVSPRSCTPIIPITHPTTPVKSSVIPLTPLSIINETTHHTPRGPYNKPNINIISQPSTQNTLEPIDINETDLIVPSAHDAERKPTSHVVIHRGGGGVSVTPLTDIKAISKSNTTRSTSIRDNMPKGTPLTDIKAISKSNTTRSTSIRDNMPKGTPLTTSNTNIENPISNTNIENPISNTNIENPISNTNIENPISNTNIENPISNNMTNLGSWARQVIKMDPIYEQTTSIDDEENSGGDLTDAPFDVRSASTERTMGRFDDLEKDYPITSVSTPCEERNGVYYCRSDKAESVEGHIDHSPVIDVCSYSNATIFLLEDGNIISEINDNGNLDARKQRYKTSNNILLTRITSFDGYLHGIGNDRKLYTLPNNYFSTTNWVWHQAEWAPLDIIHISSTHNSSHLWIQTQSTGFLYSAPGTIISTTPYSAKSGNKRVYGRDVSHYIDIDATKYTATINPGNTVVNNVYDGALSYYDEVVAIHPSERNEYRGITIVNWRPYYIRV